MRQLKTPIKSLKIQFENKLFKIFVVKFKQGCSIRAV